MSNGKFTSDLKVGDVIYEDERQKIVVTEVKESPLGPEIIAKGYPKEAKKE